MNERAQQVPGVYRELVREAQELTLHTGVPAFLGHADAGAPIVLERWAHFARSVRGAPPDGLLAAAVRGFFAAGGRRCVVIPTPAADGLGGYAEALRALETLDDVDLVCAPDLLAPFVHDDGEPASLAALVAAQVALVRAAGAHRSVAVLDGPPGRARAEAHALALRAALAADGPDAPRDAALYFPWVRAPGSTRFTPPSGAVAGTIGRIDAREGVHRAPAGIEALGLCDLGELVDDEQQRQLAALGVNCIRAFRGRGLRLWGASTLSSVAQWRPLSVRRLFHTIARWLELRLADLAFEANDAMLWNRLAREVGSYLDGLHAAGALCGRIPAEAYFIKCDAETNPVEVRDAGMLVAEIGVAPLIPQEFIALRLIRRGGGLSLTDAAG